jgi:hypothetical protein
VTYIIFQPRTGGSLGSGLRRLEVERIYNPETIKPPKCSVMTE